ncbi:hypothetical protein ACIA71_06130 [Streptomyces anulatus]
MAPKIPTSPAVCVVLSLRIAAVATTITSNFRDDQVVLEFGPGVVVAAGGEALQAVEGVHGLAGFLGYLADLEGFELLVGEVRAGRSADGGELLDVVPQGVHVGPPIDGFGFPVRGVRAGARTIRPCARRRRR